MAVVASTMPQRFRYWESPVGLEVSILTAHGEVLRGQIPVGEVRAYLSRLDRDDFPKKRRSMPEKHPVVTKE